MATMVKPGTRFTSSDWFVANYALATDAERQRDASHQVRQEGCTTRNETANKTKWDQHDNNTRLADRVDVIRRWKDILERKLEAMDKEIKGLNDSKEELERRIESLNLPEEVNVENLVLRDGRREIDVVDDELDDQLNREKGHIAGTRRQLQQRVDESFEQLCLLQEARQQLLLDLQDKTEALKIDVNQYNLNELSANISFKPDPCRIPKGTTTVQNWEDFSRYNVERADAEMDASRRLREANYHLLEQAKNDLLTQQSATDYALRKRIHELERAVDELKWQKQQTEEEIAEQEAEIERLSQAIRDKIPTQKLAQTRLENRTTRPGAELCRDNVQYGLTDEVHQLETTKRALEEKKRQAQHVLHQMEQQLHNLNQDLQRKLNSLNLDKQCEQARERLHSKPMSTTDKNTMLTGIERPIETLLAY